MGSTASPTGTRDSRLIGPGGPFTSLLVVLWASDGDAVKPESATPCRLSARPFRGSRSERFSGRQNLLRPLPRFDARDTSPLARGPPATPFYRFHRLVL